MPPEAVDREEIRARAFWSGTITFGLVSIPVNLFPATRDESVSLRMLGPEGAPLSRRYFDPETEKPVDRDEIVRGYELEKGEFVTVTEEELEAVAPDKSRDIDMRRFVDVAEIDPILFERAYYLTPDGDTTKAYRLLAAVMERTGKAGVATFVMRGREYLVAILAENGILRAETLRFTDEIRTPEDVGLPKVAKPDAKTVKKLEREIAQLVEKDFDPQELVDHEAERLRSLIEKKRRKNEDVVVAPEAEPEQEDGQVIDLMELLKRSMQTAEGRKPARRAGGDDLDALSKEELYERAQKLDVPGRSSMSKKQLISALRKAG